MDARTGVVRLRSGARSRALDGRGVAVSAGDDAVVVEGPDAGALWAVLEPVLRDGVDRGRLLADFGEPTRRAVQAILDRLDEHQLLRSVEPVAHDVAAAAFLETVARRPAAAATLVGVTPLRVRGAGPVARSAAEHLVRAGYAQVTLESGSDDDAAADAVHVDRLAPDGAWYPVAFAMSAGATTVLGPRNRDADASLEAAVRARLGERAAADEPAAPHALVGTQLALVVLTATARAADGRPGPRAWPEYLVTTSGLVSEPHPHAILPPLAAPAADPGPATAGPAPTADDEARDWTPPAGFPHHADQADVPDEDALTRLAPAWDPVLGVVAEPVLLDLPQRPVGLAALVDAEGRTRAGIGTGTAAARLDAVLAELRAVAGEPAGWTTGLGTSTDAARVDAAVRLVERAELGWQPHRLQAPAYGLVAQQRLDVVAGVLGYAPHVALAAAAGLCRVDVRAADGTLLGRAVATTPGAAATGALLRAAGTLQWRTSHTALVTTTPEVDPLDTRSPGVREQVAQWLAGPGAQLVRVAVPAAARSWQGVGLRAVVAAWT